MAKAHRCHGGGEAIAPLTRKASGALEKGKKGKKNEKMQCLATLQEAIEQHRHSKA